MAVRAVRGATQLEVDEREHLLERTTELVTEVMEANGLTTEDFISIIFTSTSDLVSEFPAYAARQLGFDEVPLMCARELEIERSMPRVIRLMAHVETEMPRAEVTHVYLHGAANLRRDLTRVKSVPDA
ncbi:MAG: chorismate mutase [Nocardioides sp.]|uniref:chorismate mutase n=1 Tax=Nocardioides nematodiphilus TaxID=2849669 RepID=UPI001CD94671|nr:chorismate mutase [Nocardioides nematodiphilus]MCA1983691.1 chorismate mutase [Nocardioides nematodiphilus]